MSTPSYPTLSFFIKDNGILTFTFPVTLIMYTVSIDTVVYYFVVPRLYQ